MHRYYVKNFILATGLVMISFVVLGSLFMGIGRSIMIDERRDDLHTSAEALTRFAESYAIQGELSSLEFRIVMNTLSQVSGNHSFICDTNGLIIACSDADLRCSDIGTFIDAAMLSEILDSGGTYSRVTSLDGFYSTVHYVSAMPVFSPVGEVLGFVFTGSDAGNSAAGWRALMNLFLLSAISIMLLSMMLSFVGARHQARPINEMAVAANKFAHGDFSARVAVYQDDEIGALSAAFNDMADSLEKSEIRRSEFITNVAHELKTPMTTISGFADGILDGTISPEIQSRYLETISSETKRLNRLVRRMLDASRVQDEDIASLRKKSFDVGELLLQTLLVFEKKIESKNLSVNPQLPESSIIVLGDADSINQVIYNLLENAVKFAAEGTELGVTLFKQGDKAYISIRNHGDTISEPELRLIFDRFHKTDRSRSADRDGVGLGLYIVKNILNNHGEGIAVTSREGLTEFVFSLTIKQK